MNTPRLIQGPPKPRERCQLQQASVQGRVPRFFFFSGKHRTCKQQPERCCPDRAAFIYAEQQFNTDSCSATFLHTAVPTGCDAMCQLTALASQLLINSLCLNSLFFPPAQDLKPFYNEYNEPRSAPVKRGRVFLLVS